jgi:hypothetical protein
VDLLAAGYDFEQRFSNLTTFGVQVGGYFFRRVRLVGRIMLPIEKLGDRASTESTQFSLGYQQVRSERPTFLYGGALGIVAANNHNFVFSPGLAFVRTDVSDYGTFVGLSLPFEWVTESGLRVGTEVNVGRAFGGVIRLNCFSTGVNPVCDSDRTADRRAGTGIFFDFQIGWGFNRPEPVPQAAPPAAQTPGAPPAPTAPPAAAAPQSVPPAAPSAPAPAQSR